MARSPSDPAILSVLLGQRTPIIQLTSRRPQGCRAAPGVRFGIGRRNFQRRYGHADARRAGATPGVEEAGRVKALGPSAVQGSAGWGAPSGPGLRLGDGGGRSH